MRNPKRDLPLSLGMGVGVVSALYLACNFVYLSVLTLECQTIARANGKSHVHNLEPEDLVALTVEAAAMAQVPLAGTDWIPGRRGA